MRDVKFAGNGKFGAARAPQKSVTTSRERKRRSSSSSSSSKTQMPGSAPRVALPPVKKGKLLSFPPLTKNWTVKGEPKWPGAEYTLAHAHEDDIGAGHLGEFLEEMKELLGEHYEHYETAMHPNINRKLTRASRPTRRATGRSSRAIRHAARTTRAARRAARTRSPPRRAR